jgi:hypothetical protein
VSTKKKPFKASVREPTAIVTTIFDLRPTLEHDLATAKTQDEKDRARVALDVFLTAKSALEEVNKAHDYATRLRVEVARGNKEREELQERLRVVTREAEFVSRVQSQLDRVEKRLSELEGKVL